MNSNAIRIVYGLGMSQVVVTMFILIYYPMVHSEIFVYYPAVVNGTFAKESGVIHSVDLPLVMPIALTSVLVALFVTQTIKYTRDGRLGHTMSYCHESISDTGFWNLMFWLIVFSVHGMCVTLLCSPVDCFTAVLSVFFMVFFLACICVPPNEDQGSPLGNVGVLGYCAGLFVALFSVPTQVQGRFTAFMLLGILDYFVVVGHTWDRAPTMDTVANCRLFWACSAIVAVGVLYATWHAQLVF